jgi:hypothetical protein
MNELVTKWTIINSDGISANLILHLSFGIYSSRLVRVRRLQYA